MSASLIINPQNALSFPVDASAACTRSLNRVTSLRPSFDSAVEWTLVALVDVCANPGGGPGNDAEISKQMRSGYNIPALYQGCSVRA